MYKANTGWVFHFHSLVKCRQNKQQARFTELANSQMAFAPFTDDFNFKWNYVEVANAWLHQRG